MNPAGSPLVDALRAGLAGRDAYYERLHEHGRAGGGVFFDGYLQGHVVISYRLCEQLYRHQAQLGRGRLNLGDEFFAGHDGDAGRARRGLQVLKAMSIFMNTDADYAKRRQRMLAWLARDHGASRLAHVRVLAQEAVERLQRGAAQEVFQGSLRPYACGCAAVALGLLPTDDPQVLADGLAVAAFFDGKRPARAHVLAALEAADRLADWIAAQLQVERADEAELVADALLLYVAAHESMAYLLYTAQLQIASAAAPTPAPAPEPEALSAWLAEAIRIDSPVQMSGRVALAEIRCGDAVFKPGDKVYLHVGAANRDPAVFEEPAYFRPGRAVPHLGFGWGTTRCVGSDYAQRCASEYLAALLQRFSRIGHEAAATAFDHGFSARGLRQAHFSYT